MKVLTLRQPWCDAVIYGGKRIENRLAWHGCSYRGPILLHAAKAMTKKEWQDALAFMERRGINWLPSTLGARGAIVGGADIVDVVMPGLDPGDDFDDRWYMGGFALLLANVYRFEKPVEAKGMLGFWQHDMPTNAQAGKVLRC